MFKCCLQDGLIKPDPKKDLVPHNDKPLWYNKVKFYEYHKVKGHKTNACMILRKQLRKFLNNEKIQYALHVVDSIEEAEPLTTNIIFNEKLCYVTKRGRPRGNIHPTTI